uniref:Uncharacterized protein n=1 Tax=Helianthus annuus TaxID=4232 RepID=A0A251S3U3_HELAN
MVTAADWRRSRLSDGGGGGLRLRPAVRVTDRWFVSRSSDGGDDDGDGSGSVTVVVSRSTRFPRLKTVVMTMVTAVAA